MLNGSFKNDTPQQYKKDTKNKGGTKDRSKVTLNERKSLMEALRS